jgi:hypothetical protein
MQHAAQVECRLVLVYNTVVHFDVSSLGVTADVGSFSCARMSECYLFWFVFSTQRNAETFAHTT